MKQRALTAAERAVCEAMIHNAHDHDCTVTDADRERWLACLDDITVFRTCGCSLCPSIDLAYKGTPVECGNRIILDACTADGVMVMLFIDDDLPSCLEVVPPDDEAVLMPSPADLTF